MQGTNFCSKVDSFLCLCRRTSSDDSGVVVWLVLVPLLPHGKTHSMFLNQKCGTKMYSVALVKFKTIREWPKYSSILFYSTRKTPKVGPNLRAERGTLWDFLTSILLQHIKKFKGYPLKTLKIFQKSSIAKKIKRGPLASSGFVCYTK